jgi:hypothetical protein
MLNSLSKHIASFCHQLVLLEPVIVRAGISLLGVLGFAAFFLHEALRLFRLAFP